MTNAELWAWAQWHSAHAPSIWGGLIGTAVLARSVRFLRQRSQRPTGEPDATWATMRGVREVKLDGEQGVVIGRYQKRLLRYRGEGHVIIIARPRSGKTSSIVVPTLVEPQPGRSFLVNDPKGELYAMTQRYQRDRGAKVYRLDATSSASDHYNIFDAVRLGTPQESGDLRVLARLIGQSSAQEKANAETQHWEDLTAQATQGLVLLGLLTGAATHPAALHELLGLRGQEDLIADLHTTLHHQCVDLARSLQGYTDNQVKSIMGSVRKNLQIYSDELVARMTCTSDFHPADLRTSLHTVYCTVPFGQDDLLNVNRIIFAQLLGAAMQRSETPSTTRHSMHGWATDLDVLVEEAPSLKKLDLLPQTINYGAGFGVRVVLITPSMAVLDELYGKHNFLESTAVQCYFGIVDTQLAERISQRLGVKTIVQERVSKGRGGRSITRESARKPLVDRSGVLHLDDSQVIVTADKQQMIVAQLPWYQYEPWKLRGDSLQ